LESNKLLFEETLSKILNEIDLKEMYQDIRNNIENGEWDTTCAWNWFSKCSQKALCLSGEDLYAYCIECNDKNILEKMSENNQIYFINIINHITCVNIHIYFNQECNKILFEIMNDIKNYPEFMLEKIGDNYKLCSYDNKIRRSEENIIYILSVIADQLYNFCDDELL